MQKESSTQKQAADEVQQDEDHELYGFYEIEEQLKLRRFQIIGKMDSKPGNLLELFASLTLRVLHNILQSMSYWIFLIGGFSRAGLKSEED